MFCIDERGDRDFETWDKHLCSDIPRDSMRQGRTCLPCRGGVHGKLPSLFYTSSRQLSHTLFGIFLFSLPATTYPPNLPLPHHYLPTTAFPCWCGIAFLRPAASSFPGWHPSYLLLCTSCPTLCYLPAPLTRKPSSSHL